MFFLLQELEREREREGEGLDLDNGRAVWMMDHAQVLPTAATYIS
jgi:hypothetical protein